MSANNGTGSHNGSGAYYKDMLDENRQHIKDNRDEMKDNRDSMKEEIHANRASFEAEHGHLKQFFKTGLSESDKESIKTLIENFQSDREALFSGMKADKKDDGIVDMTGYDTSFANLRSAYYEALRPYVDPAKMDAYNAFVAARDTMIEHNMDTREETWDANKTLRDDNKNTREDNRSIKADRWDAMKQKFTQMSEDKLNAILDKIESVRSKIQNDIVGSLLDDLKTYIQ